jgi:uncharacterized protein (DUF2147 family)
MLMGAPAFAEPSVEGLWEQADADGTVNAWFLFEKKDDVYVGRIVKGFLKPGEKRIDACDRCPGERKGARMLGLTIVYDMKQDGLHYDEGMILDPRNGSMYHAMMDLSEDGQDLSVRGYLMFKALGQTQVWHRLPDDALKTADIPMEALAGAEETKVARVDSKVSKLSKHDLKAAKNETKVVTSDTVAAQK